jgi:hypothetical protein
MENKKKYNKEQIKNRMLKNAADFWGVRNADNFDMVVKLMIESLACEIHTLANEVNNIETRILERIAGLLTPDILMSVRPAHTLLYTQPVETKCILDKKMGFYYDNPVFKQKNKITDVGFYPVDNFMLSKSCVKTLICERNVYTMDKMLNREILTRSMVRSEIFTRSLWIGIDLDPAIKTVKDISFYFDFINAENKNEYFHLLPFTQWQHKSETLKLKHGIHTVEEDAEIGDMSLFSDYDLANLIDKNIRQLYDHRFLTMRSDLQISNMEKELFPQELISLFSEEIIEQIHEPLYWFHVTFPPAFHEEILDRVLIGTNIFPVANKGLREQTSKDIKLSNTIPLHTGEKEYFLSVQSVVDTQNRLYKQLPFRDEETGQYGTYSIKKGGVERFDSRDAKEYIAYMVDLLREEGVAFTLWGRGFLEKMTNEIASRITVLEQSLNSVEQNREIPFYLIIDSESQEDEVFYVNYWVTNCELVNDIKAGTFFSPYNDTFVEPDLVISMTPCRGGRGRPASTNAVDMYKYILTSRDHIYTTEDIINFCYSEYGHVIASVEVKKGIQVSSKPEEGLIRTIDVFIDLKKYFDSGSSENLKDDLYNLLKKKSPDTFNYRIFINK